MIIVVIFGLIVLVAVGAMLIKPQPGKNKNQDEGQKIFSSGKALEDIFPIEGVEDNCIITSEGHVCIGYEFTQMPEVFSINISDANETTNNLVAIFKGLGPGACVQKYDYIYIGKYEAKYDEKDTWIKRKNEMYLDMRSCMRHKSKLFITFKDNVTIKKGPKKSISKAYGKFNKSKFEENLKKLSNAITNFENGINQLKNFQVKRLNDTELLDTVIEFYNQDYNKKSGEEKSTVFQPLSVKKEFLCVENSFIGITSLVKEGAFIPTAAPAKGMDGAIFDNADVRVERKVNLPTGYMFPLIYGIPTDHIVCTTFEIVDNEIITAACNSESTNLNFTKMLGNMQSTFKQDDIAKYVTDLAKNDSIACLLSINVILKDNDISRLIKNQGLCKTAFNNMSNSECWIENEDTLSLFFANIPGNGHNNSRMLKSQLGHCVSYFNKETLFKSDPIGFSFVDRFGNPVTIDFWNAKNVPNRNKVVFAPSGVGKSFYINGYKSQSLKHGNHILIIDIGHSYKRSSDIEGGRYFDSADKKSLAFNIFECEKDKHENYMYKYNPDDDEGENDKIIFINTILSTIWKYANENVNDIMTDMICNFYEYVNKNRIKPNITEFYNYTTIYERDIIKPERRNKIDLDSLRIALEKYVTGEYRYLLNGESEINILDDKFIVFDLENVSTGNKAIFSLLSVLIIEVIMQKVKRLPSVRKTIIIDEALNFLLDAQMGEFIAYMYRTVRKKNGEVILCTQDPKFFNALPGLISDSITTNSPFSILLTHNEDGVKDLVQLGFISKKYEQAMKTVSFGEFMVHMKGTRGPQCVVLKHEVAKEVEMIYTSKADEKAAIDLIMEKTGISDPRIAIDEYVSNILEKN